MNANVDIMIEGKIGDFFLQKLRDAKQKLWIMSPWVATEYMDLAMDRKTKGVDVRVITSNDYVNGQKEAISKLIESHTKIQKPENKNLIYAGIILVVMGFIFTSYTHGASLFVSVLGGILYLFGREKSEAYWVSKLGEGNLVVLQHKPYKMVHAKIYVVDDTVIMGSANLTGNGLKHNIEAMAVIQSPELVTKLIGMMSNISETSGLAILPYDTVGRDIQIVEPKRRYYGRRRSFGF